MHGESRAKEQSSSAQRKCYINEEHRLAIIILGKLGANITIGKANCHGEELRVEAGWQYKVKLVFF